MKAEIIVTPQVKLLLYKPEANTLIAALKAYHSESEYEMNVIAGTIAELNKINEIDIKA